MVREISEETEIQAPAAKVWEIYNGLGLANFLTLHLPTLVQKVDLLEGDGGEGTLLSVTLAPGLGGPERHKEKFVKIDNEKRIKIAEVVEGGQLDLGFSIYRLHLQIIEKEDDESSCIVKSTVQYEFKEEAADAAPNNSIATVQPLVLIAQAVNNYFLNHQKPKDDA